MHGATVRIIQLIYRHTSFTVVWKIIDFCYNNHKKQTNTVCWQNEVFLNITAGGTHSFHWAWKVRVSAVEKNIKMHFLIDQCWLLKNMGKTSNFRNTQISGGDLHRWRRNKMDPFPTNSNVRLWTTHVFRFFNRYAEAGNNYKLNNNEIYRRGHISKC